MVRLSRRPRAWLGLVCLLTVLSATAVAWARAPTEEQSRRAHAISSEVMSPFCPGSTVATCSSPRAAVWRNDILTWVTEGHSEAEIRARLQQRVPGWDLSGAAESDWNWGLPIVVVVVGSGLLIWLLRRFVRPRPEAKPGSESKPDAESAAAADELDEQIDRELDDLDQ